METYLMGIPFWMVSYVKKIFHIQKDTTYSKVYWVFFTCHKMLTTFAYLQNKMTCTMWFPTMWHFDMNIDSDEPVQPPFKLRNSKCYSVSSLTVIECSSDWQRLWSDCAYAQAGLSLCWCNIPHHWKSHVRVQIQFEMGQPVWKLLIPLNHYLGAQWLSGRVLDLRPRGRGFEPHWCHCVVVFEQDTFIIA